MAKHDLAEMPPTELPKVDEVQRLRLHNLILQQQVYREQINALILQFLQTSQPKGLQEKVEELTKQVNSLAAEIFTGAHLDPQEYQFNVETGVFVERNGIRS